LAQSSLFSLLLSLDFSEGGFNFTQSEIVPKGQFVGRDSSGARLFRAQVVLVGTLMVFGGTFGVIVSLLSLLTFRSLVLQLLARLIGLVVGVLAAICVRKEVRSRPEYDSDSPYGWWP